MSVPGVSSVAGVAVCANSPMVMPARRAVAMVMPARRAVAMVMPTRAIVMTVCRAVVMPRMTIHPTQAKIGRASCRERV